MTTLLIIVGIIAVLAIAAVFLVWYILTHQKLDFALNDVYDDITLRNLQSFELLLDTGDYVDEKFLKKLQNDVFKLYRRQRRLSKTEAKRRAKKPPEEIKQAKPTEPEPSKTITPDKIQIDVKQKGELTWG